MKELDNLTVNTSGKVDAGIGVIYYRVRNLRVTHVYVNHSFTGVDFTSGRAVITLQNASLAFAGGFVLSTVPNLFSGNGTVAFNLSRLNVTLVVGLEMAASRMLNLRLYRSKVDVTNDSLTIKVSGDDDIFDTINTIQEAVVRILRESIEGEMGEPARHKVEQAVNRAMNASALVMVSAESDVGIDYRLVAPPDIANGYLPLAFNGTGVCDDSEDTTACRPFEGTRPVPPAPVGIYDGTSGLQMMVSDYMLNTFFIAGYQNSLFNMSVGPESFLAMTNGTIALNTDLVGVFLPEIRARYGPGRNVTLKFNVTAPPTMDITHKEIKLQANCVSEMLVEDGPRMPVTVLVVQMHFDANVEVRPEVKSNIQ